MLRLIKQWLKAPVETTDGDGRRRMDGGKASKQGVPQGGVISPLVANLYMNRFLKHWRQSGRGEAWQAHVINYADDFVILSRGHAAEALAWTDRVMTRLGLSLNRTKTCVRDARQERFDFLGYSFGPHCFRQTGRWFIGASPSKKSVQRLKDKVGAILVPGNMGAWDEVRDTLNRLLRGWCGYFSPGSHYTTDRAIEAHLYDHVRNFLARRHKLPSRGTRHIRKDAVFGTMGVLQLAHVPQCWRHVVSLPRSQSESRMREIRTSGLMSGEGKRTASCSTAPLLNSTVRLTSGGADLGSRVHLRAARRFRCDGRPGGGQRAASRNALLRRTAGR